jgi:quaternary ammonium compound-resistance protein SugE
MAWIFLILGGLFEVGFTTCLRHVDGLRQPGWLLGFLVSVMLSMGLLWLASRSLPMGLAYAVWAGVGAAGTVLVGIFLYGEVLETARLLLLVLLIGSIIGLKLLDGGAGTH